MGGLNPFVYVGSNPNLYIDPLGLVKWEPERWKPNGYSTNCWNYALNRTGYGNPGGGTYFPWVTCEKLMEGAKKEGLIDPQESGDCGGDCPEGYYKVQIYLDDNSWNPYNHDYHVYRQDESGLWSHKLGRVGRPRRLKGCARNQQLQWGKNNYDSYCGTLCAKE